MIEQFIEYRGGNIQKSNRNSARRATYCVNRLENDGRFQLKDKIKG